MQAILRRLDAKSKQKDGAKEWVLDKDTIRLDETTHEVLVNEEQVYLTKVEWKILWFLSSNAGDLISRERILGECLDYLHDGSNRTVNTHLKNLRSKIGPSQWIETVRGFGYKWVGEAVR